MGTELLLTFEGGDKRRIDLAQFVQFTGVFEPLHDERIFRQVRVSREIGTIVWPNGADLRPDVRFERNVSVPATVPKNANCF